MPGLGKPRPGGCAGAVVQRESSVGEGGGDLDDEGEQRVGVGEVGVPAGGQLLELRPPDPTIRAAVPIGPSFRALCGLCTAKGECA